MSLPRRTLTADIATYVAYAAIFLFFIGPLLWLVSLSIRTRAEIFVSELRLIPHTPTMENYVGVLRNPRFPLYLWNGLKLAIIGAVGAMLLAAPAAYAFSRFHFRGRRLWMIALLAFQMISPLVIMVPLYRYMDRIGLTESNFGAGIIYVAVAAPLFTWMLKGFMDGIPVDLEEAAMIDGCTRLGALLRIVLPLALPGFVSAFVLSAILGWSQFVVPFILLSRPELQPISVGIFNFQGTYMATSTQLVAAASVLSIVPAVVAFLLLQRFIVGALLAGAVKG
jgi:multiple sugar transport system permease protein